MDASNQHRSRRQLVFGGLAAAAGAVLSRFAQPDAVSAAPAPMQTETQNNAIAQTTLVTTSGVGFGAKTPDQNAAGLVGVVGPAGVAIGSEGQDAGVYGLGAGTAGGSAGVWGESDGNAGVVGTGPWGVYGGGGVGVTGDTFAGGTGVYGFVGDGAAPFPTPNVAIEARAQTSSSMALNVVGRAKFSRSGRVIFEPGQLTRNITMSRISTTSLIIAVAQSYQSGVFLTTAIPLTNQFQLRLSKAPTIRFTVAFLVLD